MARVESKNGKNLAHLNKLPDGQVDVCMYNYNYRLYNVTESGCCVKFCSVLTMYLNHFLVSFLCKGSSIRNVHGIRYITSSSRLQVTARRGICYNETRPDTSTAENACLIYSRAIKCYNQRLLCPLFRRWRQGGQ